MFTPLIVRGSSFLDYGSEQEGKCHGEKQKSCPLALRRLRQVETRCSSRSMEMESDDEFPPDLVPGEEVEGVLESPKPSEEGAVTIAAGAVPVTIVTGFLGAGKTTLLNYILTNKDHGRRIAVIENEVGDSMEIEALIARDGVDGSMLEDNLFELKNGCICCTVKDDLVTTLEALLRRRSKFDYIIIETTGLANPGPVASVFWLDDALESVLRLDGIITLVDAKNIRRQLQRTSSDATEGGDSSERGAAAGGGGQSGQEDRSGVHQNEAAVQLAYADRILVNKTDLVSAEDLDDVMTQVSHINAVAQVHCTQHSVVDLSLILDTKCFDPELALAVDPGLAPPVKPPLSSGDASEENRPAGFSGDSSQAGSRKVEGDSHEKPTAGEKQHHSHGDGDVHNHGEGDCAECAAVVKEGPCSVHDPAVTTYSVEVPGSLELMRLERWLGDLLWEPPPGGTEVYRVKGVVSVHGRDERFVVQGVADLFEVAPTEVVGSAWREGEARRCKMVFIGRHLSKELLENGVKSCVM